MNPPEAVQAHLDLQAKNSVGIHFGTFRLSFEGIDDPEKDLIRARNDESFEVPQFGVGKEYTPDVGARFIARSRLAQ
jgi:L-ascorbate metabolism protein UlaG (beta-lactamase superfamily)